MFFTFCLNIPILSLPLLCAGAKSTSLSQCMQAKVIYYLCWGFDLFQAFFFLVDCLDRQNQWISLVSCTKYGMVTWGPAPDLKGLRFKLNILSFLTPLLHLLNCLTCRKDIMIIILLLQMMGGIHLLHKLKSFVHQQIHHLQINIKKLIVYTNIKHDFSENEQG